MKKINFHYFPRDFEAGDLIEIFLISGVINVLFWRFFLRITDYPKIMLGHFYLPHVLTGGLLMTIAIVFLLVFINRGSKYVAAVLGGAGFGLFIDEIGKYITRDNNYFYQPAIAIIYIIFILIFLASRAIEKYFRPISTEYTINALEITKEVVMHDLDREEKEKALYLLRFADSNDQIAQFLGSVLKKTRAISAGEPNLFYRTNEYLKNFYIKLIHSKYFIRVIIAFFIFASIINLFNGLFAFGDIDSFADWGQLIFSIISGLFVLVGITFLIFKSSRKVAYQMFRYAVLISIFLTQFFRFLQDQLSALTVLLISLVVLSVLQYLIYEESLLSKEQG